MVENIGIEGNEEAKSHGMSTSEYVRFVSLNAVVKIKAKEGKK